ncbi:MAG: glycosyltransferase [Selenomonadaceae bacterium]|nr:glycosyltransferase [Selenomonadaceae bacterium]
MNKNFSPLVSVVVPVYNAENYLPDCLESLLAQTFTDFEVIVVDDCSDDNSVAAAESFFEKFNGRLKIFSLPQNTGSGAVPRNEGLKFSRGEYVFFMDADDMFVPEAIGTLYEVAKNFLADVVYMNRGFLCNNVLNTAKLIPANWDKSNSDIDEPILETTDFAERMKKMLQTFYGWAPWIKFLRRDFLFANDIKFPELRISEDVIWTMELICLASRWVYLPERLYIYRNSPNSMMRSRRSPREEIRFWLDPLIKGVDFLDAFLNGINFFKQKPNYCFDVTNFFVKMQLAGMLAALDELSNDELYDIFHSEFSVGDGKHAALISNLLLFMNFYRQESKDTDDT